MYNILLTVQQSSEISLEELYRKMNVVIYTVILVTYYSPFVTIHNSNNNCANGIVLLL